MGTERVDPVSLAPPLFTSTSTDASDASKLRPSDWNRVTGLLTTLFGGADANGSLMVKNASGNGAAWTATPSVTSLTLVTP